MDTVAGLQLFIRVVETGSFSRASADLGITQPTATKHVAALEQRLGARLFHRSTRGVTPTEVGAAYDALVPLLAHWTLPAQEIHAVFTSPRRVHAKVTRFVDHLLPRFRGEWWAGESTAHGSFHAGKSAGPGV